MKILFRLNSMVTGGIEKTLVTLTNILKKNNEIDVSLTKDIGEMRLMLDRDKINVFEDERLFGKKQSTGEESGTVNKKPSKFKKIIKKILVFLGARELYRKLAFLKQKKLEKKYDVAICFRCLEYHSCKFVLKKVDAMKKIIFCHCDATMFDFKKKHLKAISQYDKIVCVSKSCAEKFKGKYPQLKDKVEYLYNVVDVEEIITKSHENLKLKRKDGKINIISVARLGEQKGFLRGLRAFKTLIENGVCNFCWHIIGDGPDREKMEEFIKNNNMEDFVVMYGNQKNPYSYIKGADLFVLLSLHEACPVVYAESMLLGVPVLSTDTCSAHEKLDNLGFVCGNNEDDMIVWLNDLLQNPEKIENKREKLKNYTYDNEKIIEKFYKLIK